MTTLCVTAVLRPVSIANRADERPPRSANTKRILYAYLLCSILSFDKKKYWPTSTCRWSSKKFSPSFEFVYISLNASEYHGGPVWRSTNTQSFDPIYGLNLQSAVVAKLCRTKLFVSLYSSKSNPNCANNIGATLVGLIP